MRFKSFRNIIRELLSLRVAYAEGLTTTARTTENDGVILEGAIKDVYSKEIEYKAIPYMAFRQFATQRTELGVESGDTINMITFNNLQLGGQLRENDNMKTHALSQSMKQLKVTEYGNAIANTRKLTITSFEDILGAATALLARDYASVVDCMLRDTALNGTNIVYARKADESVISSRDGLDSTCKLKVSTIKDAVEVLTTNNAPRYQGQGWIAIVHPHQSRDLRDDKAWINTANYAQPEQMLVGEIGRIDNVRFVETTALCNGKATEGDLAYAPYLKSGFAGDDDNPELENTDVYQAVIFGDAYYGMATALPVELRDNGVLDFGRRQEIGWYAIFGSGILHDEYGVVIETT
jgi:N4-gp56 family major capsid protein